ncbi:hypothetical protein B6D12_06350 [Gilliamella apicola]|uniref:DUF6708 domain-containing protein n=1 Tax=Gilliamella apicola TaxID=1196095 RepID=UPI000A32C672|nr:DUF6708 domain-containing protein [Gilliamella apicola]OTP90272.1 hypothetical protein B5S41_04520 [Gilliamella apicola]OTP93571.1 hypothetical protein B6D05_09545 [Gilliamella apicola]OTP94172.1 hypothetical protein B6D13_07940 [Gilliamella apicola]OTQ05603.1 hypothetical protein B6D12_06350 [Gilliamella apicola]OTQ16760.1 hypothetical protein B6D15_09055 [Gilliamella apicola]
MPSKYRPQIFGWFGDLDKGPYSIPLHDDRLIYANDNYCAFIRQEHNDQIFYTCLYFIAIILLNVTIIGCVWLAVLHDNSKIEFVDLVVIACFITSLFALNYAIPEFYQNAFSRLGSPIIFNRKTGKVYVNESYFFNFKILRHPKVFLQPKKRRIQEYDWNDMHGVIIHNFSRNALTSTVLMVCQPGTNQVIDHVMLDPARPATGRMFVWGWINSFMVNYKSADIDDGEYKTDEEAKFKTDMIEGEGWPEWMVEAFNATSLEELSTIKQKYNIKP